MTELPARRLHLVGEAEYRGDAEALLVKPGDTAFVHRGLLRSAIMACPDGCGETLVINLDPRAAKAWRLDQRGEGPTFFPSVWKANGCKSHFIVWRGYILWCDRFDKGNIEPAYDTSLEELVLKSLNESHAKTGEQIANEIDEIVYDVDRAARNLTRKGLVSTLKLGDGWAYIRL